MSTSQYLFSAFTAVSLSALLLSTGGCATASVPNPWSRQHASAALRAGESAESIGSYSAGCVLGAASLTPDGKGFQVMRAGRGRFYGHPRLVDFITRLGEVLARKRLGPLLVGDLGQARGGPLFSGHRSHQNGLDVDLWYQSGPRDRSLTLAEREEQAAASVVAPDGRAVEALVWRTEMLTVLRLAAEQPEVERLFVHAAVKKEACAGAAADAASRGWLAKLRPWWGHDDHFHVRLACAGPQCKSQEAIAAGDGCDATLDWWFSEEARAKGLEQGKETLAAKLPELPAACADVLGR